MANPWSALFKRWKKERRNLHQKTSLTAGTITHDDELAADFSHLVNRKIPESAINGYQEVAKRRTRKIVDHEDRE